MVFIYFHTTFLCSCFSSDSLTFTLTLFHIFSSFFPLSYNSFSGLYCCFSFAFQLCSFLSLFCLFTCAFVSVAKRESSKQPTNGAYILQLSAPYHFLRLFWYESTLKINLCPLSILRVCCIFQQIRLKNMKEGTIYVFTSFSSLLFSKTISNLCTHSKRMERFKKKTNQWIERFQTKTEKSIYAPITNLDIVREITEWKRSAQDRNEHRPYNPIEKVDMHLNEDIFMV